MCPDLVRRIVCVARGPFLLNFAFMALGLLIIIFFLLFFLFVILMLLGHELEVTNNSTCNSFTGFNVPKLCFSRA